MCGSVLEDKLKETSFCRVHRTVIAKPHGFNFLFWHLPHWPLDAWTLLHWKRSAGGFEGISRNEHGKTCRMIPGYDVIQTLKILKIYVWVLTVLPEDIPRFSTFINVNMNNSLRQMKSSEMLRRNWRKRKINLIWCTRKLCAGVY